MAAQLMVHHQGYIAGNVAYVLLFPENSRVFQGILHTEVWLSYATALGGELAAKSQCSV